MQDPEGYDEIIEMILNGMPHDKLVSMLPVEELLAGLTPEELLAGLTLEERLAGLELEALFRVLPVEVLRGLSSDFIATLSENAQAEIRRRIDV